FIILFLVLLLTEASLGLLIYKQTGKFSSFQIIITIFLIYAFTFGIVDFLRLDRWMRKQIGKIRGIDLLTEKDLNIMDRNKNPKYLAKKYRISSIVHQADFVVEQIIYISLVTDRTTEAQEYLIDFSLVDAFNTQMSTYHNDRIFALFAVCFIVFIIDFIYSWSYTIFPKIED